MSRTARTVVLVAALVVAAACTDDGGGDRAAVDDAVAQAREGAPEQVVEVVEVVAAEGVGDDQADDVVELLDPEALDAVAAAPASDLTDAQLGAFFEAVAEAGAVDAVVERLSAWVGADAVAAVDAAPDGPSFDALVEEAAPVLAGLRRGAEAADLPRSGAAVAAQVADESREQLVAVLVERGLVDAPGPGEASGVLAGFVDGSDPFDTLEVQVHELTDDDG